MNIEIREFENHEVITYKIDNIRFIRMVNYTLDLGKYSTLIEFVANGRKAINTSGVNNFVYSGEDALFEEYKNEISDYYPDVSDFIQKNNISLNSEDIKIFAECIKKRTI